MVIDREICAALAAIFFIVIPSFAYPINLIFIIPLILLFPGYLFFASLEKNIWEKIGLGAFLSIVINGIGLTALAYFSMFTFPRVMVYLGGITAILYILGVFVKWEGEKIKIEINKKDLKVLGILLPAIILAATYSYIATSNVNYLQGYFEFYMEPLGNLTENETYAVHITIVNHYDSAKNITVIFRIIYENTTIYEDSFQRDILPGEKVVKRYIFIAHNGMVVEAELYDGGKFYGKIHQTVRTELQDKF